MTDPRDTLKQSEEFQSMPKRIQDWILASPNATNDFREFIDAKGAFSLKPGNGLPFYSPTKPPTISADLTTWEQLTKPDASDYSQRHMFGALAHEIGHHRFNTGNVPFTGKTAEEFVQYRSELEANAIFKAFPIFRDLETLSEFKQKPIGSIGYLNELELAGLYSGWRAGRLDDATVVKQITEKVADAPYKLGNSPQDMNRDDVITHRDNYLRDFEQYVKPKLETQSSVDRPKSPADPTHPDNGMLVTIRDGVQKIDTGLGKTYDEASERMSRCTLVACKEAGLRRVDHTVIGKDNENLFAVQGDLRDPAHLRAQVSVEQAVRTPVEQSDERLVAVNQSIAQQQELARQQEELTRGPDDPTKGGPTRS